MYILIIALYALFVRRKSFYLWTCGSFKSANHKSIGSADRKLQIRKVSLSPGLRIRIRISYGQWIRIPDPDPGGQNDQQK
jgi:hypothetical protein